MTIPIDFVANLSWIHPKEIFEVLAEKNRPKGGGLLWILQNEVAPVDLYCYLGTRFGQPNGVQNFFRNDDSDNLIHWDWTLKCEYGWVSFLGMNFRTEIHFIGHFPLTDNDRPQFLSQLKADLKKHRGGMVKIQEALEKWSEFINPYQRLRRSVDQLFGELKSLGLEPEKEKLPDLHEAGEDFEAVWKHHADKYSRAVGLCFGVRSMLPVMAEAFVNLLLFVLMRPELKKDKRLREHTMRQAIDIRIKTLHMNCVGFEKATDYNHPICKAYHAFVNVRNDLLHGSVVIEKLKFNEVYFHGKVPIFKEYRSMWERSLGAGIAAVGMEKLDDEVQVVEDLIKYLLGCLQPSVKKQVEHIVEKLELGINLDNGRIGILFPDHLVDMRVILEVKDADNNESPS